MDANKFIFNREQLTQLLIETIDGYVNYANTPLNDNALTTAVKEILQALDTELVWFNQGKFSRAQMTRMVE